MTCTDFELKISAGELDASATAHLGTCRTCRAHAEEVKEIAGLAALPDLSGEEQLALARVSAGTRQALRQAARRRGVTRRVLSFAIAAGLGAVLASGVAWKLTSPPRPLALSLSNGPSTPAVAMDGLPTWELSAFAEAEVIGSDEENFYEVSWPSLSEGEVQ